MEHPADDVLLRFLVGATSRPENRQVVRHLLARCPVCAAKLRAPPPASPADYDQALARLIARLREPANENEDDAEEDRRLSTRTSGNVARRRWLTG